MSIFDDEELTVSLCKFGGPVVLFVCTPVMAWIFWKVAQKEMAAGIPIHLKSIIEVSLIIVIGILFGGWMCRKGYGWFGGKKW